MLKVFIEGIDGSGKDTILETFVKENKDFDVEIRYVTPIDLFHKIRSVCKQNNISYFSELEEFMLHQFIHILSRAYDYRVNNNSQHNNNNQLILYNRSPLSSVVYYIYIGEYILGFKHLSINRRFLIETVKYFNKFHIGPIIFIDVEPIEIVMRLNNKNNRDVVEEHLVRNVRNVEQLRQLYLQFLGEWKALTGEDYYVVKISNDESPDSIYARILSLILTIQTKKEN